MNAVKIGLIGSGWRAEFYLRIAKAMPDRFIIQNVLIRDAEKGKAFSEAHQISVVNSLTELLAGEPDFVVLAVKRGFVPSYLEPLFNVNMPVLCETPPAETIEELNEIWNLAQKHNARIQVAEQYFLQPLYYAWEQVIKQGQLGEIENINISSLHGYHGVSIIRRYLAEGFNNVKIYGKRYEFRVTETLGRKGIVTDGEVVTYNRDRLTLEFSDGKIAFFDFSDPAQYHSFIRTRQLTVQGTRGEIDDMVLRSLNDQNEAVTKELKRVDFGVFNNQEWSHYGLTLGENYIYKSPFYKARLNDDEIAVASCMEKMSEYVETGVSFYNLDEALQDMYISILMDEALDTPGKVIESSHQEWSR